MACAQSPKLAQDDGKRPSPATQKGKLQGSAIGRDYEPNQ
jgi:hypothetical protein